MPIQRVAESDSLFLSYQGQMSRSNDSFCQWPQLTPIARLGSRPFGAPSRDRFELIAPGKREYCLFSTARSPIKRVSFN